MRITFTRWRSGGLLNRPSPRKRLPPKKKTSSGFEFVSGLAAGASAMPAKWSRPVFSFKFYEGKISRALIVSGDVRTFGCATAQRLHEIDHPPRRGKLLALLHGAGLFGLQVRAQRLLAPKNGHKPKPSGWPAYTSSADRKGRNHPPRPGSFFCRAGRRAGKCEVQRKL